MVHRVPHHRQQIFIVHISEGTKSNQLAPPCPPPTPLPSEVKYSATLVRVLGCIHLSLGAVTCMLGFLGKLVEPETSWAGAGIWGGLVAMTCGLTGLLAHKLWYKNFSIKTFLVASVTSVVIHIMAIVLTVYAVINRHEHYRYLMEEAEKNPWYRPYNLEEEEHQLTLSISINQLVGFAFELILSLWSMHIGWQGVCAEEFTSLRKDVGLPREIIPSTLTNRGQQVPVSAIYQLLQTHPELMALKGNGNFEPAWELDERQPHFPMDYQERFNFYLTRGIEDGSLSPSSDIVDIRDTPSPDGGHGSPAASSTEAVVFPVAKNRPSKTGLKHNEENSYSNKSLGERKKHTENGSEFRSPAPKFQVQNADKTNGSEIKIDLLKKTQKSDKKEEYQILEEMGTSEKIPSNTENATINTTKKSTHSRAGIMNKNEETLNDQAKRLGEKETKGEKNKKIRTDQLSDISEENQESDKKQKRVEQAAETRMNEDSHGNKNPLNRREYDPEETNAEEPLDLITNLKPPSQFQDL
ncbi:uncharacterized protein LOC125037342 isoform X1 [Penaeus chinensis]|uniref:uncharacterized protein LOC125037342 isoform X1 n=1 Tax=Penaeus chinensis TaxID=139456 RepID=UPI001FB7BCDE|nr:uncharacterized protein LOC125037342 isoform X1 [Penaeus chinensis]XP_047486390.1 uncharacterized protein LOC125037342 isoform X1 [Penaeus chinensis]XP_047486391.1 uncharacterized protein LOC125037342 isoform X1 [Penaeus chinensis]XP_047486392.1 uncharacterized protein LOC125037342 isoform X1 [Penaeus chinensis]